MKLQKNDLQIAIDGPVGAGKSVGAHCLAQRLNILYVYTGAMYRAVAWAGLKAGLGLEKERPLIKLLSKAKIKLSKPDRKDRVCNVLLNGKDITDELFTPRVHWGSSQVAVFPHVRKHLVKLQQEIAKKQAVVMEGRDIATVVLPQADLKIYMTANLKVRARRRLKDLLKQGEKANLKKVTAEIKKRDYQDLHRKADPLKITSDAWVLDTTNLSIDEEVDMIIAKLKEKDLIE